MSEEFAFDALLRSEDIQKEKGVCGLIRVSGLQSSGVGVWVQDSGTAKGLGASGIGL